IAAVANWTAPLRAILWVPAPLAFALGYLVHLVVTPALIYVAVRGLVPGLDVLRSLRGLIVGATAPAVAGRVALPYVDGAGRLVAFALVALVLFHAVALAVDGNLRRAVRAYGASWRKEKEPALAAAPAGGRG